jgi:GNAT superfamily N-acetyltransferase
MKSGRNSDSFCRMRREAPIRRGRDVPGRWDGLWQRQPVSSRWRGTTLLRLTWILSGFGNQCAVGDLVAPLRGPFLTEIAHRVAGEQGPVEVGLVRAGVPGPPPICLQEIAAGDHPGLIRSYRVGTDVRAFQTVDGSGVLSVGRWEAGVEVHPASRGRGSGRALAEAAALHLISSDEPLFLQVSSGNVASLRAVLVAGFVPIGAEILFGAGTESVDPRRAGGL